MSGPIVRKYGFPNFEKIFGERPLQHGEQDGDRPEDQPKTPSEGGAAKAADEVAKKDSSATEG